MLTVCMNVIQENIQWNLHQSNSIFLDAGERNSRQRSGYYKASLLLVASVVEAAVFLIVKDFYYNNPDVIDYRNEYSYRFLHRLAPELFKEKEDVFGIYKKEKKMFVWKDDISFQSLNQIGLKHKIFARSLYNKLERVRLQRNKIHLQSLRERDHKYTKRDVEYVFSVAEDVFLLLSEK